MGVYRILLVEDDEDDFKLTKSLLEEAGEGDFELVWARTYDEAILQIRGGRFDAYLVDYRLGRRSGLDLLCGELKGGALAPVFILTGQEMGYLDEEARRHGASAYLLKKDLRPLSLATAVLEAIAAHAPASAPATGQAAPASSEQPAGRLVAMVGAKGGVGTTTLVANVAAALRARVPSTMALEMRGDHGPLADLLGATGGKGIGDLMRRDAAAIDEGGVEAALSRTSSGLRLLAAPREPREFGEIPAAVAAAVCRSAVRLSAMVVVDLPSGASAANHEVLALADLVVLVTDRDPASVAAARAMVSLLRLWQVGEPIGSVVVSRTGLPEAMSAAEINTLLGLARLGVVPPAAELFHRGVETRQPVVLGHPAHPAGRALEDLATALVREPQGSWRVRVGGASSGPEAVAWGQGS